MPWLANAWVLRARRLGRHAGVNRLLARLLYGRGYERRFDAALASTMREGDVVWDVGANVGHYARQFAERVGDRGRVVAFEPMPENLARLQAHVLGCRNVSIVPVGLGSHDAVQVFVQGEDGLGATSRMLDQGRSAAVGTRAFEVTVRRGDGCLLDGFPVPNIMKIDVEGFELEVLDGMPAVLADPALRAIGVEVHFAVLDERGLPGAARRLEATLRAHGFRLQWCDASHVLATRG